MDNSIKQEIKRKLRENYFERTRESTSWKLNTNKLWLSKVSKSIFLEKVPNTWKKYNVEILLDISGSMSWSRIEGAHWVLKELIQYFLWVLDTSITLFNLLEYKVEQREMLKIKDSQGLVKADIVSIVEEFWKTIYKEWEIEDKQTDYSYYWNWEVCNLVGAFERLKNKDWDKIIILIGDWSLCIDDYRYKEDKLQEQNFYIAGQPIKKYNRETYKKTVDNILWEWVEILPICIWHHWYDKYFPNAKTVWDSNEVGELVLEFLNDKFWR